MNSTPSQNPADPPQRVADAMWKIESEKLRYPAQAALQLELFKSANERGSAAIKASILINGGSAVAILAFIGHLASVSHQDFDAGPFAAALVWFVSGVWTALIATGVTYVTARSMEPIPQDILPAELERRQRTRNTAARITNWAAITLVAISFACFTIGCWVGYRAISRLRTFDIERLLM